MSIIYFLFLISFFYSNVINMEIISSQSKDQCQEDINIAEFFESQENANIQQLPKDIWKIIFVFVKDNNYETEEELFNAIDSFKAVNKQFNKIVNEEYLKETKEFEKFREKSRSANLQVTPKYRYFWFLILLTNQRICGNGDTFKLDNCIKFKAYKWYRSIIYTFRNETFANFFNLQLSNACKEEDHNLIKLLLQLGADPNKRIKRLDYSNQPKEASAFMYVVKFGKLEILKLFLNYRGSPNSGDPNLVESVGGSDNLPLTIVIGHMSKVDKEIAQKVLSLAKELLESGADPEFPIPKVGIPSENTCPLLLLSEYIEDRKEMLSLYQNQGGTPEDIARVKNDIENFSLLLELFKQYTKK